MRYKGKLLIEFTKNGISFPYKTDEIKWYWPWRRVENYKYGSTYLDKAFLTFKDYVNAIYDESPSSKIVGYNLTTILIYS